MRRAWPIAAILWGGCFDPAIPYGLVCDSSGTCPRGQFCDRDGVCRATRLDAGAGDDGGGPLGDAAVDAGVPFVFDDSLRGSTTGTILGGQVTATGWRVLDRTDRIWWPIPPLAQGAIEFTVTGMSNTIAPNMVTEDVEIFAMYEAAGMVEPVAYFNEYRDNFFKVFIRIFGEGTPSDGAQTLVWVNCPSGAPGYSAGGCPCSNGYYTEPSGGDRTWSGGSERIRIEWNAQSGSRLLRGDEVVVAHDWSGQAPYTPFEVHVSLGTPRSAAISTAGAPVGAIFSDLHIEGTLAGEPSLDCSP